MNKIKYIVSLVIFTLVVNFSYGQLFSPYSQYGLGLAHNNVSPVLTAMGGIGAAYSDPYNVNYLNPASLADMKLTVFDIGLRLDTRSITNTTNKAFTVADGGLNNFSISFPVVKNTWGMSFGLLPYTFSKYKTTSTQTFNGATYTSSLEGNGSLYKVYLGNGVKWKGIKAGINTEFIFGKLENDVYNTFTDISNSSGSRLIKSMSIRDIVFNAGLQYTAVLTKFENQEKGKENLELTVGAYYAPSLKVDAFVSDYLEATTVSSTTGNPYATDTAAGGIYNQYGTSSVPTNFGAGINIGKQNKWNVGLDYDFKSWVKFNSPISTQNLTDEWHIKLGGAITPDIESKKFFNKVTYRLGTYFGKAPIIHENAGVSDFGITFGFGIPVSRYRYNDRYLSNLNFAFEIGALGSNKDQNLKENYYNFTLTYTLSDKWFNKQKFD